MLILITTTTSSFEGRRFVRYLHLVAVAASAELQFVSAVPGTAVVTGRI